MELMVQTVLLDHKGQQVQMVRTVLLGHKDQQERTE